MVGKAVATGALRPLIGPVGREAAGRFLLAQGWEGLQLGDALLRWEAASPDRRPPLLAVVGPTGEVLALALGAANRLRLLMPLRPQQGAVRAYLKDHLAELERVSGLEGQLTPEWLPDYELAIREVTVAPSLRPPERALPSTRPARPRDAGQLHHIYEAVSWMRLEGPAEWERRIAEEPTWVAEEDGALLAAARWTKRYGQAVEVGGVATAPEHRRRGAATAVVLAATAAALIERLTPVLCFMQPELAPLYLGLGYERVGRELVFQRPARSASAI